MEPLPVTKEREVIPHVRATTGANDLNTITQQQILTDIEEIKYVAARETMQSLQNGNFALFDIDAPVQIVLNLLYLRVAERRRLAGDTGPLVPSKEVPEGIGRLRRHSFDEPTLAHWRNEMIRHYNRIQE